MTDLPLGWVKASIADVADVQGGIQKQAKRRPLNNKYPFLRVANVGRGILDLREVHEVELFNGEIERFALRYGDLLVVEGNGSPSEIGRAAMWHGEIENCVHQNHLIRVRPTSALIPKFLELAWNSPDVIRQLREVSSSTSGLHTLSTAKIKAVKLPLPPLTEQRRIVATLEKHLSRLDQGKELVSRCAIRSLRLRRSVLNQLIPDGCLDGRITHTILDDFIVDSRGGWSRGSRHLVPAEAGVPYLKMNNITAEGFLDTERYVSVATSPSERKKYELQVGDVLFNSKNSAELVGKSAVATSEVAGWVFNENIIRIQFHGSVLPEFAAMQMNSDALRRRMREIRSATTNVAAIYMRDLRKLPFWVPCIEEQRRIIAAYESERESSKRLESAVRHVHSRATTLRQSLLREAFVGRLVPQDPDDEPASVLLERIKAERAAVEAPKRRAHRTGPKVVEPMSESRARPEADTRPIIDIPAPSSMASKGIPVQETLL